MKVLIIGGGFAGLTLANALDKAGIDFLLLEARKTFDPVIGATIGLGPGAMRILDQIGAAQEILDQVYPLKRSNHRDATGKLIVPSLPSWEVVHMRFGYPEAFLHRHKVIRAMWGSLSEEGKKKLLLEKRVKRINHSKKGVVVECDDGSSYEADVVLGCDGVHSKVRSEMWRIADEAEPGYLPEREKTKMTAEYMCLYGNSNPVPGFNNRGDFQNTYEKNQTLLSIVGPDFVGWFLMMKMDRLYHYHEPDFPKFTKADADRVGREYSSKPINDEGLTFKDIWERVQDGYALVPMEEGLFEKWSFGRAAIVGDAAHKMTANHGQAGNNSIESAVAVANELVRLDRSEDFSHDAIVQALQNAQKKRQPRLDKSFVGAADVCRMQCLTTWKDRLLVFGLLPYMGDLIAEQFSEVVIGSEVLEFLPLPERSFTGTCGFNPTQGTGNEESRLRRALIASPLLLLSFFAKTSDDSFFPSTIPTAAIYAIWLLESNRRANALTPMQIPTLFAMLASCFGIEAIAPWYYFLHYTFSPIEKFATADLRMTNVAWTRTVLPTILLLIVTTNGIWTTTGKAFAESYPTLVPLAIFIFQWLLVRSGLSTTNLEEDVLKNQQIDLPSLKLCIHILSGMSALPTTSSQYQPLAWTLNPSSLPSQLPRLLDSLDISTIAAMLWLLLLTWDLKWAGMTHVGWAKVVLVAMGSCVLTGPTATILQGWLWREEMLVKGKEKYAHTRERLGGKSVWEVEEKGEKDEGRADGSEAFRT